MAENWFFLSQLIAAVRDRMQVGEEDVEEITAAILDGNNWNTLLPDVSGEREERIFNAIVSSNKVIHLIIPPPTVVEASSLEQSLRRVIPLMHSLTSHMCVHSRALD
jgi:hypothetical protein